MIDPADATQVGEALASYVAQRPELAAARIAEPPSPTGRGFDSFIYAVRLVGDGLPAEWWKPLVVRVQRAAGDAYDAKVRREAAVQRFAADSGYPALVPLAVESSASAFGLPFTVMPRIAGPTLFEQITSRPWRTGSVLRQLAGLHARLHRLRIDGCPLPNERPYVETQMAEVRRKMSDPRYGLLREEHAWVERNFARVLPEEPALLHNDFHPLNVLVDPASGPVVIDWTDAAIGDRHADVARTLTLFWVASIAASNAVERTLLRLARGYLQSAYLREYRRLYPVDAARLACWEALSAFGGLLQLAENRSRSGGARTEFEQRVPPDMLEQVRGYFWQKARAVDGLGGR